MTNEVQSYFKYLQENFGDKIAVRVRNKCGGAEGLARKEFVEVLAIALAFWEESQSALDLITHDEGASWYHSPVSGIDHSPDNLGMSQDEQDLALRHSVYRKGAAVGKRKTIFDL